MSEIENKEETYFKCSECNEFHVVPSSDKERQCTLEHRPSVSSNTRSDLKYCQSCIERGFKPPNPATREWDSGIFYCEECFDAVISNLTMIPKSNENGDIVKHKFNGKSPILNQVYEIFNVPPELQFDRVDTVCRNYEKLFNFRAPSIVNKSLDELTIELEAMKSTIFYIQYFGEPNEIEIKRLKEEKRKEKQLSGVRDTAEAYVKGDKKPSKVKADKAESLAAKLGISMDVINAAAKTAREKEFKNITGVCSKCGTAHKEDECPPGVAQIKEVKKPVQPTLSANVVNVTEKVVDISREALLAKARQKLGK